MKTPLLTLTTAVLATVFSSCCVPDDGNKCAPSKAAKQYDAQKRLVKDIHHDGNYTTYHYNGEDPDCKIDNSPSQTSTTGLSKKHIIPKYNNQSASAPPLRRQVKSAAKAQHDGSWKPRIP